MQITVAKDAGYCFGVRDAVNMAYDAAKKNGEVYMLGSIVHNEKVVDDLKNIGANIIHNLSDVPEDFVMWVNACHVFLTPSTINNAALHFRKSVLLLDQKPT